MNIDFTDDAMIHAIEKTKGRAGIRFALMGGGCAGFQYEFDYADGPQEGDIEIDFGKFKMWICPMSENMLDGTVISWKKDGLISEGFQFNNPGESAACGCGVSVGFQMAFIGKFKGLTPTRKCTSQGQGGRGRRIKISTSTMNKNRKRSHKKYRGQGR